MRGTYHNTIQHKLQSELIDTLPLLNHCMCCKLDINIHCEKKVLGTKILLNLTDGTKNYIQIHIKVLDHCHVLLYGKRHMDRLVVHLDFVD